MGVHDNMDSKYNIKNLSGINQKRPTPVNFRETFRSIGSENEANLSKTKNIDKGFINIQQQRQSLPVYRLRNRLLEEIRRHDSLIIIGETGSGKTTQIPQLLLNSGIVESSGCIGITEPRRVAAVTVARRVAQEQGVTPGKLVGYCVRFEDVTSPQTKIKFLTDGMMVREAMNDENLENYSVIILDEAHERSVQTDILFGVVRRAQNLRKLKNLPQLKLLIMSATMDVDKFEKYFKAPTVYLEGRQHQVKIYHSIRPMDDYAFSAMVTAFQIHRETPPNEDILVFLTGQEEIEAAVIAARQVSKQLDGKGYPNLKIFPLYSSLPTNQQLEAFKNSPPGMRKLVFSTNVAETSITMGGIRHVIDTGVAKCKTYHPTTGLNVLKVEKIAKAQAWQRTGRGGRECAGKCYRTYTKDEFNQMKEMPIPEIQRCSLNGVILQLLTIGIDVTTFDFMDKPPVESVNSAVACLERLGAVKGSPPQLTKLGETMSLFPLEPQFTKVLLASVEYRCLEEALTVIALLSCESIFTEPPSKRTEAKAAKARFSSSDGDHVTMLNIYRGYISATQKKLWCQENYLHFRNLEYAENVRAQLTRLADRACLEKSSCGTNTEPLRQSLLEGLSDNLAELQRDRSYVTLATKQPVVIHPSSTLHALKPPLVLYTEIVRTGKYYLRGLSVIESSWLKKTG